MRGPSKDDIHKPNPLREAQQKVRLEALNAALDGNDIEDLNTRIAMVAPRTRGPNKKPRKQPAKK